MTPDEKHRQILGIRFFTGTLEEAVEIGMRGGLVVVPSAPVLEGMPSDSANCEAVVNSDLAIPDSGLMVLFWNLLTGDRIPRISGLKYLQRLLQQPALRAAGSTLWVMPSEESMKRNLRWLQAQGFATTIEDCYIAPRYPASALTDETLLRLVRERRPPHIVVSVGGGVQEKLGYYLKVNAGYRPAIHCTGAAIGFLSGDQVNIPNWADRCFLGWAIRCLYSPGKFIPRYWKARVVVPLLLRFRERCPTHSTVSNAN